MALIDELKQRRQYLRQKMDELDIIANDLLDLNIAIDALEGPPVATLEQAPAQPVHPEAELRSVTPATEENSGDQLLTAFENDHIVERAPLIDAQTCEAVDPHCSWKAVPHPDPTDIHGLDEATAKPFTDLWQQGYNDKLNGFEPSLAEPEYTKGYEARALIEREHSETMERAKFFEGGMMADADRHQSDQRSIVEKIGGLFKREREDA